MTQIQPIPSRTWVIRAVSSAAATRKPSKPRSASPGVSNWAAVMATTLPFGAFNCQR
ncbi:hypothetical protein ACIBCA_13625 [Kitasatospora sp. NPDC051170]|uniref:hypothetical protein n=1 Tax=Kitasatospora sp. NPDC051170 TaxID=3364056 RepID=UPI0037B566FE